MEIDTPMSARFPSDEGHGGSTSGPPDALAFPACLHGPAREVKRKYRKIARQAWEQGTWDNALQSVAMLRHDERPGWIMLDDGFVPRSAEALWRMYVVPVTLCDLADRNTVARLEGLILSGMSRFWYTVGMLRPQSSFTYYQNRSPDELREDLYRPMLHWFVFWLPELLMLAPKFCDPALPLDELGSLAPICWFAANVVDRDLRVCEICERYQGDLVSALLAEEVIERDGQRYRLRE